MLPETIQMVPEMGWSSLGTVASVAGTAITGALVAKFGGVFPRIPENYVGLRTVGGSAMRQKDSRHHKAGELYSEEVLLPGNHITAPYFRGVVTVSLKDQRTDLDVVRAQDEKEKRWLAELTAKLDWHVVRRNDIPDSYGVRYSHMIYRAIFNADEGSGGLPTAVNAIAGGKLRNILLNIGPSAVGMPQEELFTYLQESCAEKLLGRYAIQMDMLNVSSLQQNGNSMLANAVSEQKESDSESSVIIPLPFKLQQQ